jgi:nucleoside recognition membrane protein YjiH
MNDQQPLIVRLLKGFAMFWWDFLVGDTPELFVAALVIIGTVALLSETWHVNTVAVVVLPVLAVVALTVSVKRASDEAKRK